MWKAERGGSSSRSKREAPARQFWTLFNYLIVLNIIFIFKRTGHQDKNFFNGVTGPRSKEILVEQAIEGSTLAPVVVAGVHLLVRHVHVHSRARLYHVQITYWPFLRQVSTHPKSEGAVRGDGGVEVKRSHHHVLPPWSEWPLQICPQHLQKFLHLYISAKAGLGQRACSGT